MAAEVTGHDSRKVIPTACGIELIHTYSLIHDDLPCMDDDDFRRGKPTNHRVFGEAVAVLTGDALLTLAFELIASNAKISGVKEVNVIRTIKLIGKAAGTRGMVGGQVVDIESEGKRISPATLKFMHEHKTGALIKASIEAGAIISGANEKEINALGNYGKNLGLAFQLTDDVLNVTGDAKKTGKAVGSDKERGKTTFPSVFGLAKTREKIAELVKNAQDSLSIFKNEASLLLGELAFYVQSRDR